MTTIPDPYSECETALRYVLLELTDFFKYDYQVSSNDVNIARGADYFVILRPGSFPIFSQMNTGRVKDYDWNIITELYTRYTEYEESFDLFKAFRAAIFWKLNMNPLLECKVDTSKSATNVWGVTFSAEEPTQYFKFANTPEEATPNFIIQPALTVVRQRVEFNW